jgi:anti-anti-sigma factor
MMKVETEVNVKNIRSFYTSLKSELEKESEVILDLTDTVRIDSSAAQVIISAMSRAAVLNKKISITGASPEMKALLSLAGL